MKKGYKHLPEMMTMSEHTQGHHTQGHHTQGHHTQGHHTQGHHTQGHHTQGHHTHTLEEWDKMLKRLAEETREHRHNLYKKVDINKKKIILDVGCGTGVITADIASLTDGHITGIDTDNKMLAYAKQHLPDRVTLLQADGLHLPFNNNTFDLVVFNLFLNHVTHQQKAVTEMARVTKKGGIVLATMEPDYAGGFSYPENEGDRLFKTHFKERGIEMHTGRKLKYYFSTAGLIPEVGLCMNVIDSLKDDPEKQTEKFLETFERTEKFLTRIGRTKQQIQEYKEKQLGLIRKNVVFSFDASFYAIGGKL
jgi:ubiquinone/menaquinone biosynthesis C-methylase UbiE